MMKKLFQGAVISLAVLGAAHAADPHGHDHKPAHGGVLAAAGEMDYELVVKADSLTLHVLDHGKPVATTGAKGSATLHAGSEKTSVALEPAGENRMVAKGSFKTGVGVRVAVTITFAGKPEAKLNFRLK